MVSGVHHGGNQEANHRDVEAGALAGWHGGDHGGVSNFSGSSVSCEQNT